MKIALFGGAGFIGVNLTRALAQQGGHDITVIDAREEFFAPLKQMELPDVHFAVSEFPVEQDFDRLLVGMDVVYHLVSTTNPSTSNKGISHELEANIVATSRFLESCVRVGVGRVFFPPVEPCTARSSSVRSTRIHRHIRSAPTAFRRLRSRSFCICIIICTDLITV